MTKRLAALAIGLLLLFGLVAPTQAQFADQPSFAGTGAGTANAQTITLPNATSYGSLVGVLIKYIPGVGLTNTTAATLAVSGNAGALPGGPIAFRKPSAGGLVALTGGELVAGQPVWIMLDGASGNFDILSVTSTTVGASNLANSALAFGMPVNLQINVSVASNQLTIAAVGNNGNNPSGTNPVILPFRDTNIAHGDPTFFYLEAAQNFTIGTGSTMGCVNNQMCRLWVLELWNGTSGALCAFNALNGTTLSIFGLNEAVLVNSQPGTSGGSNPQEIYCNASSLNNYAFRIIGFIEIQETTAGTWATGPTFVQLFGPGIKKPGDVVQRVTPAPISSQTTLGTSQTQTGIVASISPTSPANIIEVTSNVNVLGGSGANGQLRISRGTGPTLFGDSASFSCAAQTCVVPVYGLDAPNTTSSTAYWIFGISSGSNIIVNDAAATYPPTSSIVLREIMSSLEPANDNQPLRMVG